MADETTAQDQSPNRRFTDDGGLNSPIVLLSETHYRVGELEKNFRKSSEDNTALLGQLTDSVTEIKIDLAKAIGKREGIALMANVTVVVVGLIATVATAWATVKSMAVAMAANPPPPPPH